ncbi:hypothetical protein [Salinimicrobium sp. TH3]|uniref:hypothetical protein n=1 Tax=Salinimicrobium sp. TH3 TaxID=2997342 RepID=UPI0022757ABD|nr:hypothetical protein [Salinimicrobium sp. TH3]MCY2686017.1 hypothetical protein [Salinimicrobium sp. TH3]
MTKTNLFLLLSFLMAASLTGWFYYQVDHEVGEINYDDSRDDPAFELCDEDRVQQDYSPVGANYRGGKKAIERELLEGLQEKLIFEGSGLITLRFVVNCKGETGRFRIWAIDGEIQEKEFIQEQIHMFKTSVAQLEHWEPGWWEEKIFDSYYQVNFKIKDGKITDIF